MSLPSRYHQRNALPNRSRGTRPRSFSLAEYQPLNFDRQALESAYQASLSASSGTSWRSSSAHTSSEALGTAPSTLSSHLKPGDNPHLYSPPLREESALPGGMAGIGAGHSLTPPHSPFHKLGPVPSHNAMTAVPPSPPAELSGFREGKPAYSHAIGAARDPASRRQSYEHRRLDMDDFEAVGYDTDPGPVVSGPRRLPEPPSNVPPPDLPQWEPDYKPQIPASLTQPSIQNAYAQLSAPPPNLPPGPTRPMSSQAGPSGSGWNNVASSFPSRAAGSAAPQSSASGSAPLPAGAPDFPPSLSEEPDQLRSAQSGSSRPRPEAEKEVSLRASDRTPIWSTHLLDPSLRSSVVNIPHQVTNITNVALSGLAGGQRERYNSTIGAPVDGLARMAQEWVVPPHGRFSSENGGIELGIGIIDSHAPGWGRDKGRKRARVEISSKHGGIKVDVLEIDSNRQLDLKVETRSGDVLVLLPDNYYGPIHVNAPAQPPIFLSILQPQLAPISNPYNTFFTTFVVPLQFRNDPRKSRSIEHKSSQQFQKYTPKSFREESELFNKIQAGYAGHVREEQDKVVISSQKGRIVLGYRDSLDEQEAAKLDLKVGVQNGGRKKRWWRG